ncbi:hypothetical protein ES703_57201 [subsurface metagenome]
MKHGCLILLILILFIASGCAQPQVETPILPSTADAKPPAAEEATPTPTPTPLSPPTETPTPPPAEYPAPSIYYPMDNVHEVGVRPEANELYVMGMHSPLILVVDISSPDYPVVGDIWLPGGETMFIPQIVFSDDGKYAYVSCHHNEAHIESWGVEDANYIAVIDCLKKDVDRIIPMKDYQLSASTVASRDGNWLYFTGYLFEPNSPSQKMGIGKLDLRSQEVVNFLPMGDVSPSITLVITLSKNGEHIYVAQGEQPELQKSYFKVIDAEDLKVVSSVEVGDGAWYVAVTPDGQKAYVSNRWSNDVTVINLETMEAIKQIAVGPEPREIAITPDGGKAYVTLPGAAAVLAGAPTYLGGNSVAVVDTREDILLGTTEVCFDPESIAMDPDGTKVYVADGGSDGPVDPAEVHIIDTANDAYLRPIILKQVSQVAPSGIDVTPDNSKLFITSWPRKSLIVIDVASSNIIGELNIDPRAVKVSADGSNAYIFIPSSRLGEAKLSIIDTSSLEVTKSINLGKTGCADVGPTPSYRIVLNNSETIAYINYETLQKHIKPPVWLDPDDTGLVAVDLVKGEVISKIAYSEHPDINYKGIALTPDDAKLLVSDSPSQTVVVVDTSTNAVIDRIKVGNNPTEIKITQDGKRAYVLQQHGRTLLTIIDLETHGIIEDIQYPCGVTAQMDFELSADERYVYIPVFDSNFVHIFDMEERKTVKVIDTGLDPLNIAITADKRYIYVSEVTGDQISVIDTTTNSLIKTIKLGELIE